MGVPIYEAEGPCAAAMYFRMPETARIVQAQADRVSVFCDSAFQTVLLHDGAYGER